ncbi:esterase [Achromobacter aloeverae]|uniref:Esterase n=1 Tax=Achromobacter aloeverae TaxID=1750518 RepID=A0A4Q1HLJ1_9BURK|nr:esterase [Achromobacter aloeverae]RXN91317.1 esterase [Achromobacter aloeverae]
MSLSSAPSGALELLAQEGPARQLFILLHGVGGTADPMKPLAVALRQAFPQAAILAPAGFEPYDGGGDGRQWFSTRGVDDANRPQRVAAALSPLVDYIRASQARFHLLQSDTALAGFSQGAIMALEAVSAHDGLAGRVLAFSGRYARLPQWAPQYTTIHLLHGAADAVMPVAHAEQAQARLNELHGDSTIDVATRVGHELHPALIERAIVRLQTCVPLRSWEAALGLNQHPPSGSIIH